MSIGGLLFCNSILFSLAFTRAAGDGVYVGRRLDVRPRGVSSS